jgi:hypothetical protein
MILVFVPRVTNRLKYTFNLILGSLSGLEYRFTSKPDEFLAFEGPKFVYDKQGINGSLYFAAADLLFQRGISITETQCYDKDGFQGLFPVFAKDSALPFDPFASAFYMVSRYEEYLPYRKDMYGRFTAHESLAYKKGFLHKAVVNRWAMLVAAILRQHFELLTIKKPSYKFVPTVDVDSAWSYRHKGFWRTLGGYTRSLSKGDFADIITRVRVIYGLDRDPFDSFASLHALHEKYDLKPLFFILFADYGQYDKNVPVLNPGFINLVKSIADYADVGIHPSYASNSSFTKLKTETQRLSDVLKREIRCSRQHFLKLELPVTYRNLINLDIMNDYTMGYAAEIGFRAGICTPFPFYDLDLDAETPLMVHPFTVMDGTLKDYLKIPESRIPEYLEPLIREVKETGGTFISLWHNETHGGQGRWAGWPELYRTIVEMAV